MIRYRPIRNTLTASLKDEELFNTVGEMLSSVHDSWRRVVLFMGSHRPFRAEEMVICGAGRPNPMTGYKDEHRILVSRMADQEFSAPVCIGYCDLG